MTIESVSGGQPHESWGGWRGFLDSCEKRDEADGVVYYGKTNCNYILFPDGTLLENFSISGQRVMNEVRERGAAAVLAAVKQGIADLRAILATGERLHNAQNSLRTKHPVAFPPY